MQTGRALHKKRSLVSQPPAPQWFLDFLSSQKELPREDQYPLGRCPKCKRTDAILSPSHDHGRAECASCGHAGSKNEFIIVDVGYGYPPDQCPACSGFWSEADTDESPTDLCRMFCRQCGFERYYFLADFTPRLPRGVPNLCPSCGKEWQRQICHYRNLVWMLCLSCGHPQYYIRHGRGRVEPVQCLQYALRGEHSWKRFKSAEGGYEQRCQFCHTPKFDKTKHRYLTNLGIIEEWLVLHQIPRVADEYDESDEIDLAISESLHWTTESVSDMGYVYDVVTDEGSEGADAYREAQETAPTAPLAPQGDPRLGIMGQPDAAKREMRKRYRRMLQRQEIDRIWGLRKRQKIEPLIAKIRARCESGGIQDEELDESLEKVERCLETFDAVVTGARTNARGTIPIDRLLSDEELNRLAAAATWFYVSGFTREQVAGTTESIFPNVPIPTMKNWVEYVRLYDSLQ